MLILAAVSIATLTGENGLLARANDAKMETEQAAKEEEINLQKAAEAIDKITQVTDTAPGILEGEGIEQNPYVINSIEDLVVFSYEVTNGRTFIKDDGTKEYVELGQSLDFQSDKSYVNPNREDYAEYGYNGKLKDILNQTGFITIGIMEYKDADERKQNSFSGNFNGNGYKIYNLRFEKEIMTDNYISIGFFNSNYGNIENINLEQSYISIDADTTKFVSVANLVANNYGKINNCYTTGKLDCTLKQCSSNVAGLVASNSGEISYCYNTSNVVSFSEGSGMSRVSGLVGSNEELGIIKNVYNIGAVNGEKSVNEDDSSINIMIGGIIGYNHGNVVNAYTTGKVSNQLKKTGIKIGSIVGFSDAIINNCYYLENTVYLSDSNISITTEGEEKTSDDMKQVSFIDELNEGNETNIWKLNSNINQGYPILYWQ